MAEPPTADDLLPLVAKLPHDEQVRLAKLVLRAARDGANDAAIYRSIPVGPDEFRQDDDGSAWDALGWEDVSASR